VHPYLSSFFYPASDPPEHGARPLILSIDIAPSLFFSPILCCTSMRKAFSRSHLSSWMLVFHAFLRFFARVPEFPCRFCPDHQASMDDGVPFFCDSCYNPCSSPVAVMLYPLLPSRCGSAWPRCSTAFSYSPKWSPMPLRNLPHRRHSIPPTPPPLPDLSRLTPSHEDIRHSNARRLLSTEILDRPCNHFFPHRHSVTTSFSCILIQVTPPPDPTSTLLFSDYSTILESSPPHYPKFIGRYIPIYSFFTPPPPVCFFSPLFPNQGVVPLVVPFPLGKSSFWSTSCSFAGISYWCPIRVFRPVFLSLLCEPCTQPNIIYLCEWYAVVHGLVSIRRSRWGLL